MTRTLAITTATPQIGVALAHDGVVIAETCLKQGRRHGELLAPTIQSMMSDAGWRLPDLARVAVDIGPGLFTGLRVGLATAKALAAALDLDLVGCSSLALLAQPHLSRPGRPGRPVASIVDARRGEVFLAVYGAGGASAAVEPTVCTPEDLVDTLKQIEAAEGPLIATGDGARRYEEALNAVAGITVARAEYDHPSPSVLAVMATTVQPTPPAELRAVYLRGADVRIGWEQRHG